MNKKLFRQLFIQNFASYMYEKQKIFLSLMHTEDVNLITFNLKITSDFLLQNIKDFYHELNILNLLNERKKISEICQETRNKINQCFTISDCEKLAVDSIFAAQTKRIKETLILFMNTDTYRKAALKLEIKSNTISQHIRKVREDFKQIGMLANETSPRAETQKLKNLLNTYIDDSTKEEIIKSLSDTSNKANCGNESDPAKPTATKGIVTFTISVNKENHKYIWNILNEIKNIAQDDSIKLEKKECGSIKLTISGTPEGCQRLKFLFDSGELTEILGSQVTDVSSIEIVTEDSLWTNIRTWVQSNILPNWDLEEIVGGTITALRANPNFFGTPAFDSLRSSSVEERSLFTSELLDSLSSQDLNIVRLAAQKLAEIEANTPEAINSLKDKLNTIEDIQTQWQIALSLGIIAPEEHPQAKAQKQIIELGDTSLELIIATKNDEDDFVNTKNVKDDFVDILVEIRPDWDEYLPTGLEVKILEESGEEEFWLDDIDFTRQVNDEQSYIYFSFWGTPGDKFILQLSLNNVMLRKNFQI